MLAVRLLSKVDVLLKPEEEELGFRVADAALWPWYWVVKTHCSTITETSRQLVMLPTPAIEHLIDSLINIVNKRIEYSCSLSGQVKAEMM